MSRRGRVELADGPDATELRLYGEIDLDVEQELTTMLTDLAVFGLPVIVDMAAVTFLDSCGIRALIVGQRAFEEAGSTITLRTVPQRVRRLLEVAAVDTTLPIIP